MKTRAFAIIGAATLWSACVTSQEAHADGRQISPPPQHSYVSDPDVHPMVVASNDDDCDDSDPTWMPAPSTGVLFDTGDKGFVIKFMRPRSSGVLVTDDCDDGDPSWMPAPPFSALVTIGQTGGRAWELQDETQTRVRKIVKPSTIVNTFSLGEIDGALSSSLTGGRRFRQEMQKIVDQLSEDNAFVNRALADGHMPYLFLRPRGN